MIPSTNTESIRRRLKNVRYPLSTSLTLPPGCYVDREWFEHELDRIFRQGWLCIGRKDSWPDSGAYRAFDIAGIPVVVVRRQEDLLALSNVCRHRGSLIAEGSGTCRVLTCPFHGWTYDLSGKLVSAARMEETEGFRPQDHSLATFPVEEVDGFVFLSLESDPPPLSGWLVEFSDIHARWMLDDLRVVDRRVLNVRCNWKQFLEVFNEYYHLLFVHPHSIGGYFREPDPPDAVFGNFATQFGMTSLNAGLLEDRQDSAFPPIPTLDDRERCGVRYTWVYPNMAFGASSDFMWSYYVFPISPDRTEVVQYICFPSSTVRHEGFEERSRSYIGRIEAAIGEDIPALEKQFAGLKSPHAAQGRFAALEPCVGHFACWYADVLGEGPDSSDSGG
ncbi:MAG: aromatic ring-hydroxylating dioxygenase subunit alpha [Gammaproteobacteria bacterium]|nr:aromatic ring-hydroxylating dioxygenase subunit alpha [Gammaproteobacteria bacterium]